MKRIVFLIITVLSLSITSAQNITDALRYSTNLTQGTARFTALSGAFGALGGDLSGMSINPAGSSVFLANHASFSFAIDNMSNNSIFFNTTQEGSTSDFSVANAGLVFVFDSRNERSPWKKFTIGLNYNIQNNYDNDIAFRGTTNNTVGDFFTQNAQGIALNLLQLQGGESISDLYTFLGEREGTAAQNAFLGFQGFIFDPIEDTPQNSVYQSNLGSGSYNQSYNTVSSGFSGKYTFNFSTQYNENLYFGLNLNSYSIDYFQNSAVSERNSNPTSTVKEIYFEESLSVLGNGFSAQIGAIAKINESFRLGVTFNTPTWFNINEETTQYLETSRVENNQTVLSIVDPRIINVFERYRLRTPTELSISSAYIFGKKGLISFDYSVRDFSSTQFRPTTNTFFANQNNSIEDALAVSGTYRLGGEYRIKQLSLRGGLSLEESPYKDTSIVGNRTGFSLGLGYNLGNYNLDIAYAAFNQEQNGFFNNAQQSAANIDGNINSVILTLGFNL